MHISKLCHTFARNKMKKMGRFNVYTLDECMDAQLGEKGTPERDEFEREVEEARQAWLMGEAIKEARKM